MTSYEAIPIAGGDTAMPLSLQKRLSVITRHVQRGPSTRMLDCGCGSGGYVRLLRNNFGIDAVGVEYLENKVAEAKRQPDVAPYVAQGDIQEIPYSAGGFDAVLLNEVIEHVPDEMRALKEIHRILKPGGKLIIFAPNRIYPFETHGVYLKNSEVKLPPWTPLIPYIPVVLGKWVFRYWARNYWPGELQRLLVRAGFKILQTGYVWQTFENISGQQPWLIARFKKHLRSISCWENEPFSRVLGCHSSSCVKNERCLK